LLRLAPMKALFPLSLGVLLLAGCGGTTDTSIPGAGGAPGSGGAVPGAGGVIPGSGGGSGSGGAGPASGGAFGGSGGAQVCCLALATCQFGDTQINGPSDCPAGAECYSNSICCTTVWCIRTTTCNPAAEYNRNYVGSSPSQCAVIDFVCPAYTTYFSNQCGCGCEQDASCPQYVDCMPGGPVDPLCASNNCPYTLRAY
jgi:hypothetical protein